MIKEEELKTILPLDGPSTEEVKKYLKKYSNEYIVIKCGWSGLIDLQVPYILKLFFLVPPL